VRPVLIRAVLPEKKGCKKWLAIRLLLSTLKM
jgi:hypothetical protein